MLRILCVLLACVIQCFCLSRETESLKVAHVYFRHGSRTPALQELYPGYDDKDDYIKTLGYKEMTKQGKKMMYDLGHLLRRHFGAFLETTNPHEIVYTKTSNIDRTKISALAVLAGLFPPDPSEKLDPDLNWTPIPYHYAEIDYEFQISRFICPAYMKEFQQIMVSDEVEKYIQEAGPTFEQMKIFTGTHMDMLDIFNVSQGFHALSDMNLSLPVWATDTLLDSLDNITLQLFKFSVHTTLSKRLLGGRTFKAAFENLEAYSNDSEFQNGRKLYLNSVHDTNVGGILGLFDMLDQLPRYGSTFLFELHNSTTGYTVKVFYIRDPYSEPQEMHISGCGDNCSLDNFLRITKPYIPIDIRKECNE